jgi:hypothetical protein
MCLTTSEISLVCFSPVLRRRLTISSEFVCHFFVISLHQLRHPNRTALSALQTVVKFGDAFGTDKELLVVVFVVTLRPSSYTSAHPRTSKLD